MMCICVKISCGIYFFIINLFEDSNINIILSILSQTSKDFDSLIISKMCTYVEAEGI
jgi:hypothetical protein